MRKTYTLLVCLFLSSVLLAKQPLLENNKSLSSGSSEFKKFGIGIGVGFGFFNPEDVNNWLEEEYSNYYLQMGSFDIFMNAQLSFSTTIRPVKFLRLNIIGEAAFGPKLVATDNAGSNFHNFGRYSAGAEAFLNVPIGSGKHSLLFGVGALYHFMYFEDYNGGTVGLRVIPFGMSFQFGKFQPQILLGGDLNAIAMDGSFELNYNQGFLHFNFLF